MSTKHDGLPKNISLLEETIGYTFQKKEYALEALRHSSYVNENRALGLPSNERLEFLGDAVLSLVTSSCLFGLFEHQPEGDLTKLRADLVCTRSLSGFARRLHLGDYVLLGHGQELVGGRDQDKILEDAFEALLAAIYLDSGKSLDTVAGFLRPILMAEVEKRLESRPILDPKSHLQEIVQEARGTLCYVIVSESGPDHDKRYECEVLIDNNVMGKGTGSSKKKAEIAAAEDALRNYIRA